MALMSYSFQQNSTLDVQEGNVSMSEILDKINYYQSLSVEKNVSFDTMFSSPSNSVKVNLNYCDNDSEEYLDSKILQLLFRKDMDRDRFTAYMNKLNNYFESI